MALQNTADSLLLQLLFSQILILTKTSPHLKIYESSHFTDKAFFQAGSLLTSHWMHEENMSPLQAVLSKRSLCSAPKL